MDLVQIIETLGIPVAVAFVLGYACLYLMKFITGKLIQRLAKATMQQASQHVELIGRFDTLISVFQKFQANGLKSKHGR